MGDKMNPFKICDQLKQLNDRVFKLELQKSKLEEIIEEKLHAKDILNNNNRSSWTVFLGSSRSEFILERLADSLIKNKGKF